MSDAQPPQNDPRLRPFRIAMWGVYLFFTVGTSLLVTFSVLKSTATMYPKRPAAQRDLSVGECAVAATSLVETLESRRAGFAQEADPAQKFLAYRVEWLKVKRQLEADCRIDAPERVRVREAFDALDDLLDVYTRHSVQFDGQVAPELSAARRLITSMQ